MIKQTSENTGESIGNQPIYLMVEIDFNYPKTDTMRSTVL